MQAAIKVARQFKIAEQTGDRAAYDKAIALSEQMPAEKDTRVECPHCHRKFAESKYFLKPQELHIQGRLLYKYDGKHHKLGIKDDCFAFSAIV